MVRTRCVRVHRRDGYKHLVDAVPVDPVRYRVHEGRGVVVDPHLEGDPHRRLRQGSKLSEIEGDDLRQVRRFVRPHRHLEGASLQQGAVP